MRKTLSFACLHFSVAFTPGRALTGNWRVGGMQAITEPLCSTVVFHVHEKLWQSRQAAASGQTAAAASRWHAC